jgi:hypothetical protein
MIFLKTLFPEIFRSSKNSNHSQIYRALKCSTLKARTQMCENIQAPTKFIVTYRFRLRIQTL